MCARGPGTNRTTPHPARNLFQHIFRSKKRQVHTTARHVPSPIAPRASRVHVRTTNEQTRPIMIYATGNSGFLNYTSHTAQRSIWQAAKGGCVQQARHAKELKGNASTVKYVLQMLDWQSSSLVHAAPKAFCADAPGVITASTSSAPPSTALRRIGDTIAELVLDLKSLFQMHVRSNGTL